MFPKSPDYPITNQDFRYLNVAGKNKESTLRSTLSVSQIYKGSEKQHRI
ncbi:17802_t:CDS:2 [Entrophospora sp. SA101]|nr:17802_t:CDS:2 [Entrophospora sp. SA101]